MNARVFVVHEPMRRNDRGGMESQFDLTRARRYGELVPLLNGRLPLSTEPIIEELQRKLRDFHDEDHLLAVGSPTAIAWAAIVAARANSGRVKMLVWDRESKSYISVPGALC